MRFIEITTHSDPERMFLLADPLVYVGTALYNPGVNVFTESQKLAIEAGRAAPVIHLHQENRCEYCKRKNKTTANECAGCGALI